MDTAPLKASCICMAEALTTERLELRYGEINLYGGTLECNSVTQDLYFTKTS